VKDYADRLMPRASGGCARRFGTYGVGGCCIGANGFFTSLSLALRAAPGVELAQWWGQRRCAQAWGELVRPDGYCRVRHDGHAIELWLEWDRGTEPLHRVAGKLERYEELALALDQKLNVAIVAPGERRERDLREALPRPVGARALITTALRHHHDPLGANWLAPGADARLALTEL
jgi:hypothetical protein